MRFGMNSGQFKVPRFLDPTERNDQWFHIQMTIPGTLRFKLVDEDENNALFTKATAAYLYRGSSVRYLRELTGSINGTSFAAYQRSAPADDYYIRLTFRPDSTLQPSRINFEFQAQFDPDTLQPLACNGVGNRREAPCTLNFQTQWQTHSASATGDLATWNNPDNWFEFRLTTESRVQLNAAVNDGGSSSLMQVTLIYPTRYQSNIAFDDINHRFRAIKVLPAGIYQIALKLLPHSRHFHIPYNLTVTAESIDD